MNYFKVYYQLCMRQFRSERFRGDGNYYEAHHVKPSSVGGKGKILVLLTAREHFLQHLLLTKMFPDNTKLQYAFNMMFSQSNNQERYLPPSKWYEYRRKIFVKNHPQKNPKIKQKISKGLKKYFQKTPNKFNSDIIGFIDNNFVKEIPKEIIDYDKMFEKGFTNMMELMTKPMNWNIMQETETLDDW